MSWWIQSQLKVRNLRWNVQRCIICLLTTKIVIASIFSIRAFLNRSTSTYRPRLLLPLRAIAILPFSSIERLRYGKHLRAQIESGRLQPLKIALLLLPLHFPPHPKPVIPKIQRRRALHDSATFQKKSIFQKLTFAPSWGPSWTAWNAAMRAIVAGMKNWCYFGLNSSGCGFGWLRFRLCRGTRMWGRCLRCWDRGCCCLNCCGCPGRNGVRFCCLVARLTLGSAG